MALFFDGEIVDEALVSGQAPDQGFAAHIGSWGIGEGDRWWHGRIDEVRMLQDPRPPVWIQAEFRNQNDPTTFAVQGPVEFLD
jgi:hypothetical protein